MLELRKGTQLADRYNLVRSLGGGGEATLWLAKDRLTAAFVTLKIVSSDEHSAARLRDEWQTSIRLMHAHIARAFEYHAETDAAFFSQQYVDGPDISALTGLPPHEVLAPIGLIADALRYMHAKGLVHRDIKASNILLDHNGAPYLTDFGLTATIGALVNGGSPIAQSPQSLSGESAATADDVFALGGLIYELVSGAPAYSSSDTVADIRLRVPDPLRAAIGTALPPELVSLVANMLDKDARRRPDAETVAKELEAAGFAPGTATVRSARRAAVDDEIVEVVGARRLDESAPTEEATTATGETPGIGRSTAFVALGVLLLVLTAVVFILPNRVQETADLAHERSTAADDPFGEVMAESPSDDVQRGESNTSDSVVLKRLQRDRRLPTQTLEDDDEITFSENEADYSGLDAEGRARFNAELTLGELLSAFQVLEGRGVERWAPVEYSRARDLYTSGDKSYLEKDFAYAEDRYVRAIEELAPLYDRIEPAFLQAYEDAILAFDNGERLDALRLYDLAVAITPGHPGAEAGLKRAKNLEAVLRLIEQGLEFEEDLELEAAQRSFAQAVELDEQWEPAQEGLRRVTEIRTKMEFDSRMTEGFDAIAAGDYLAARAAFRVAEQLIPESNELADGFLQVDQGLQLQEIGILEQEALSLEQDEHWDAVVKTYEEILKVDNTLSFAKEGIKRGREMSALHQRLDKFAEEPDRLSSPSVMQKATLLVVDITTRSDIGPRLAGQRDELTRLLKRAATPLQVPLLSDNLTEVSIYRVGRLGSFLSTEVSLRPGTYVAVGIRPGYRDVRQEFRVAPEVDIEAVVVRCEERI